jgi:imidazolonepropionase-like amidohydrolase
MEQSLHIRGVLLPDGQERDLFVRDGRITFQAADDARTILDRGYVIPGLVDAHAHLPLAGPAPDGTWEEKARANARAHLDAGVLVVRDPGGPTPREIGPEEGSPRSSARGSRSRSPLGATSWEARSFLGLLGLEGGGLAALVACDRNPLEDPAELANPTLIVLDGRVIRSPSQRAAKGREVVDA